MDFSILILQKIFVCFFIYKTERLAHKVASIRVLFNLRHWKIWDCSLIVNILKVDFELKSGNVRVMKNTFIHSVKVFKGIIGQQKPKKYLKICHTFENLWFMNSFLLRATFKKSAPSNAIDPPLCFHFYDVAWPRSSISHTL